MKKVLIFSGLLPIFFFFLTQVKTPPAEYWDEHVWIGQSYFFERLIKTDFNSELWRDFFAYDEPKLTSYIYGMVLYPQYLKFTKNKPSNYDFGKYLIDHNFYWIGGRTYQQYLANKKNFVNWRSFEELDEKKAIKKYGKDFIKTLNIIWTIRKTAALFLFGSAVMIFFIFKIFFNPALSLFLTYLYSVNSVIFLSGIKATSESIFLFFLNLATYFMFRLFLLRKNKITDYLLFGVFSALANQTKLNGILILIIFDTFFFGLILKNILIRRIDLLKKQLKILVLVHITFALVFIATNPFLYSNPINNSLFLYTHRCTGSSQLQKNFPKEALFTPWERINSLYSHIYKERYRNFGLPYFLFDIKSIDFNNPSIFWFIDQLVKIKLFMFFSGLLYLFVNFLYLLKSVIKNKFRSINISSQLKNRSLIFMFFLLVIIAVSNYLLLDWFHYYAILIFPMILAETFGFVAFFKAIKFSYSAIKKL